MISRHFPSYHLLSPVLLQWPPTWSPCFHSYLPAVYFHRIRVTLKTHLCSEPSQGFSLRAQIQDLTVAHKALCDPDSLASLTSLYSLSQPHSRTLSVLAVPSKERACSRRRPSAICTQSGMAFSQLSPSHTSLSLLRSHLFREAFLNHLF